MTENDLKATYRKARNDMDTYRVSTWYPSLRKMQDMQKELGDILGEDELSKIMGNDFNQTWVIGARNNLRVAYEAYSPIHAEYNRLHGIVERICEKWDATGFKTAINM